MKRTLCTVFLISACSVQHNANQATLDSTTQSVNTFDCSHEGPSERHVELSVREVVVNNGGKKLIASAETDLSNGSKGSGDIEVTRSVDRAGAEHFVNVEKKFYLTVFQKTIKAGSVTKILASSRFLDIRNGEPFASGTEKLLLENCK